MVDFSHTLINQVSIHQVGNHENGILRFSDEPAQLNEEIRELLQRYFLKPFKSDRFFNLDLKNHDTPFELVRSIFHLEKSFHSCSIDLVKKLFEASEHSNIRTGEFFVVHFTDCLLEDELVEAIGVFKSESKETFLKIFPENDIFRMSGEEGININKLDKGAIIFNTGQDEGYLVQVVDQANSNPASYWRDGFLKVKMRLDDFNHTHEYLQLCRDFVMEELPTENRGEKIGMVHEAVNYFNSNEQFNKDDFEQQVIRQPELIDAFEHYSQNHDITDQFRDLNRFEISPQAVRYSKQFFKSVIKLDKNFHIYVHGGRDRINKGFDSEKALSYYKVYFEEEN